MENKLVRTESGLLIPLPDVPASMQRQAAPIRERQLPPPKPGVIRSGDKVIATTARSAPRNRRERRHAQ